MSTIDVWADVLHIPCPTCHAAVDERCRNPITNEDRHIPCKDRLASGPEAQR